MRHIRFKLDVMNIKKKTPQAAIINTASFIKKDAVLKKLITQNKMLSLTEPNVFHFIFTSPNAKSHQTFDDCEANLPFIGLVSTEPWNKDLVFSFADARLPSPGTALFSLRHLVSSLFCFFTRP